MRLIVSGQSGLAREDIFREIEKKASDKGNPLTFYNVGKAICDECKVSEEAILNLPLRELSANRRMILERIAADIPSRTNAIINTHSTFRWEHALFPAFDFEMYRRISPDLFVTLIDDVDAVAARLKATKPKANYSLKDLIVWREEEIIVTESVAGMMDKPHYIVPRRDANSIIYSLLFEQTKKKVYMSFPMSLIRGISETEKEVEGFKNLMREKFIAFDPAAISEKRLSHELKASFNGGEIDYNRVIRIKTHGKEHEYVTRELHEIDPNIDGQIVYRDFKLINQSDMVIAFIPTIDGRPQISQGMERELEHAHNTAKGAFIICPAKKKLSPWGTGRATQVFESFDEAMTFFHSEGWV